MDRGERGMDQDDLDQIHAAWRRKAYAFCLAVLAVMLAGITAGLLIKRWLNI